MTSRAGGGLTGARKRFVVKAAFGEIHTGVALFLGGAVRDWCWK